MSLLPLHHSSSTCIIGTSTPTAYYHHFFIGASRAFPCGCGNLFSPSLPGRVRFQQQLAEEKAAHRRLANKTAEAAQGREERDRLTVCRQRLPLLPRSSVMSLRLQAISCGVNGFLSSFGGSLWVKTTASAPPTSMTLFEFCFDSVFVYFPPIGLLVFSR